MKVKGIIRAALGLERLESGARYITRYQRPVTVVVVHEVTLDDEVVYDVFHGRECARASCPAWAFQLWYRQESRP